jgi:hypothetical protein
MFNMQSGIHRKTFGGADGHKKPITGLVTDSIHRYLITASVDRTLKVSITRLFIDNVSGSDVLLLDLGNQNRPSCKYNRI